MGATPGLPGEEPQNAQGRTVHRPVRRFDVPRLMTKDPPLGAMHHGEGGLSALDPARIAL